MAMVFTSRKVVEGENGRVPAYQDPPHDPEPKHILNNTIVLICEPSKLSDAERKTQQHDGYSVVYDFNTRLKIGFVEDTHLKAVSTDPTLPGVDWDQYDAVIFMKRKNG